MRDERVSNLTSSVLGIEPVLDFNLSQSWREALNLLCSNFPETHRSPSYTCVFSKLGNNASNALALPSLLKITAPALAVLK